MEKIVFVTGTDTGVGKSLATALLLCHLRQSGVRALAMKPFCSGGREDVELLQAIQDHELSIREVNPFYFPDPIAPLVAARKQRRQVLLEDVTRRIRRIAGVCDRLIVEGSGGLMVPLGEGYTVAGLIERLDCGVVVIARNKLGTINHTVLTVQALRRSMSHPVKVVLMEERNGDVSSRSNAAVLRGMLAPIEVFRIPFLGLSASLPTAVKKNCEKIKKVLAQILR